MTRRVSLTTMLSWAWVAHTIEIDNRFEAASANRVGRCVRISLPMWTNGLRHLDDDGVTVDTLRARARARCNLGGLERWGWISIGDADSGRRSGHGSDRGILGDTVIRPTQAGSFARQAWPQVVETVEGRWRSRFGDAVIDALRAVLSAEPTWPPATPWSPPEVAPADGFRTRIVGGPTEESAEPPERHVPLVALLGQTLTKYTMAYERSVEVSLPLAANLLRVVDDDAVRSRDLPRLSGISKEAVAMALTYLSGHGLAIAMSDKTVTLTTAGKDALDRYRDRTTGSAANSTERPLRAALNDVLTQTSALSAGLTPPPGCWRAENPYLAHTRRLIADPTGSLPWHPMVLHRAGWPDGS